ncbi:MAG TPA: hypothetical protein VK530_10015, partial [Candidatus Acidoferrum sp.]|nr:hypothetical protein [Candidatus Acidoferrum sp.]
FAVQYLYQWQRESTPGTWANVGEVKTNSSSWATNELVFPALTLEDAGNYRVNILHDCTNRISPIMTLVVQPRARLSTPVLNSSSGIFQFQISGNAGSHYRLESSTDLTNWLEHVTYSNTPPIWSLTFTNSGETFRFFRLRQSP